MTAESIGNLAQGAAVIFAAISAIGCLAAMGIIAGRTWSHRRHDEDLEHLGVGVEFDNSYNPPTE